MDRLSNSVRPYAWGSTTAIPRLLGAEPTGEPQAELWMGAHPGAPSRVDRGDGPRPLDEVIAEAPERELGPPTVRRFGPSLPFLLKVLAAAQPLSLQVHPDREQARAGFADEERRGVPIDAPHRTYKDANHKPEALVALDDFDALCGFRRAQPAAELFEALAAAGATGLRGWAETLRGKPEPEALREVLTDVLSTDRAALVPVVDSVASVLAGPAAPEVEAVLPAAARRLYAAVAAAFPGDPGVIAALLLNPVRLAPGEALYLAAGVPHAYVRGLGVEIMANSDNVLRCGLTPKHVDVPELLRIVRFEGCDPAVLRPEPVPGTPGEAEYRTPFEDFRLSRIELDGGPAVRLAGGTPQILLCTAGGVTAAAGGATASLAPGQSVYLPAHEREAELTGSGTVFRATVAIAPAAAPQQNEEIL